MDGDPGDRARPEPRALRSVGLLGLSGTVSPVAMARAWGLALLILVSAGCTNARQWWANGLKVGPNYQQPAAAVADQWIDQYDPRVKNAPAEDCAWWGVFCDPTLNELIETAYRQNLDLQTAGTRILESRSRRNIAAANLFPQSQSAIGGYAHAQISENLGFPVPHTINIWADGFNASWEIDFWGRYRRGIESADAGIAASAESYGESLVLVLSEVATNYVQLRTFEQRLQYARENVELQRKTLALAEDRFRQGATSEVDVQQATSSLAQTEASVPVLEAGHRIAGNRLCILLGTPPTDLASQLPPAGIPIAPPEVAIGIPADLLSRRPDIRRAEREVAAQSAQIGVAEADLYPHLGVTGFIGYAADDFRDLFNSRSLTSWIIPTLQWNVLNYGRIRNNVRIQDVRLQAATLRYQKTVLDAGREVEDALVQFIRAQQQAHQLERSVASAKRSVELVTQQYEGGIADFNRLYTMQIQLVQQQDQLAAARGNIALALIQVYRSIGGSWECFIEGQGLPHAVPEAAALTAGPDPADQGETP